MTQRDLRPSASYLWLERDEKILLHQRANTGYMDGMYQMPAGHVDPGEVPSQAIIREAMEEIGITILPKHVSIQLISSRVNEHNSYYDFFFTASEWSGEPQIMEPDKCTDLQWFALDNLPTNIIPYNKDIIELARKGLQYAEEGVDF